MDKPKMDRHAIPEEKDNERMHSILPLASEVFGVLAPDHMDEDMYRRICVQMKSLTIVVNGLVASGFMPLPMRMPEDAPPPTRRMLHAEDALPTPSPREGWSYLAPGKGYGKVSNEEAKKLFDTWIGLTGSLEDRLRVVVNLLLEARHFNARRTA
jgi:hypothetical protein